MEEVGNWMGTYGHTIYETRGGPWPRWIWGGTTYRGTTVFIHVEHWPELDDTLILPLGGVQVLSARMITPGNIDHEVRDGQLRLRLPLKYHDGIDTIIEVTLDRLPIFDA